MKNIDKTFIYFLQYKIGISTFIVFLHIIFDLNTCCTDFHLYNQQEKLYLSLGEATTERRDEEVSEVMMDLWKEAPGLAYV